MNVIKNISPTKFKIILLSLLAVGISLLLYFSGMGPLNGLSGINLYSNEDISINIISKDEFENAKVGSVQNELSVNEKLSNKESNYSYLRINNEEYITYPYNRNGNYQVFDYGIILRQQDGAYVNDIFYLDLKTGRIEQLSNEIRAYENAGIRLYQGDEFVVVSYADGRYYVGDGGGNKDIKVALFSKNGNKKIIATFKNRNHSNPEIINGFVKNNKFYFEVTLTPNHLERLNTNEQIIKLDQYYVAEVLNKNFADENIFYKLKDPIENRNITDLKYEERIKICDSLNSIDCKVNTAISYGDKSFCKSLLNIVDNVSINKASICYSGVAIKMQDNNICSEMPELPKMGEMFNLALKERCMIEASVQLLTSNSNFCNDFKHSAVKDECNLKRAILNSDEGICEQVIDKYSLIKPTCRQQVQASKILKNNL